jgi:SAM-dependent methyltransferase
MIRRDGWNPYCIWEHSATVRDLYLQRCRREAEEMTSHRQAAELLASRVKPGETLLDAGCGSGYFYHALSSRGIPAEYWGVDAAPSLIEIGRAVLPAYGLSADHLMPWRIEDLDGTVDHTVCLNVLSNIDNYHRPLERLLKMTRGSLILRESLKVGAEYHYVEDRFLDPDVKLKVHVNHYDVEDVCNFIRAYGFSVRQVIDERTGGKPEDVIGYPHYWTFLVADRLPHSLRSS